MNLNTVYSICFLFLIQNANADFMNFGDGRKVPFISVSTIFENDILKTETSWMIIRDCDRYVRNDVTASSKGQTIETKSSCTHRKICGFSGRGAPSESPITCDVFVKNF